ncbi:hypothetical protein [Aurantimonas sp. 22II-16-19i]|uniref:hypothetical protein n=1 Tax=Aurantimonas sp. 22II-16-19i TaxID=1317114 RepID=UPI0009F7D6E4|nr:hypothetical protein [Aurantimonas sp. 22II-16-19i]ORE88120.1 hypothetical protein ATO4_24581 [Aurantimonas sp. 22II-16-19i]
MRDHSRNVTMKWVIIIGAVIVALGLFGLITDWFGLTGDADMVPGETIPEQADG